MQKEDSNLWQRNINLPKNNKYSSLFLTILIVVSTLIIYITNPVALNVKNPSIYILFIAFMFLIILVNIWHLKSIGKLKLLLISLPFIFILLLGAFFEAKSWAIWDNGKGYYEQVGKVEKLTVEKSNQFQFNKEKNYVVNREMAIKIADKKMGAGSLSSQYRIGEATLQQLLYNGKKSLYWVINLEYNSYWTQFSNGSINRVILVDANKPQESGIILNKDIKNNKYKINLSSEGYFNQNLERMAQLKNPYELLTDFSFELDDNLSPHYIVTTYTNARGFGMKSVTGIIDIDLKNNAMKKYNKSSVPDWIDRINPVELVQEQINNHGNLVHGLFNFSNKDTFELTDSSENYIYIENEPFFISGVTSKSSDQSLVGIFAKSLRSNKIYKLDTEGAVEQSAKKSAEGKVQNYGYKAMNPIIIYKDKKWTYLVPLVDNESLIKQFALVDIQNYQNVRIYDDIESFTKDDINIVNNESKHQNSTKEDPKSEIKKQIEEIKERLNKLNQSIEQLK